MHTRRQSSGIAGSDYAKLSSRSNLSNFSNRIQPFQQHPTLSNFPIKRLFNFQTSV
jgi:hypothetical protein